MTAPDDRTVFEDEYKRAQTEMRGRMDKYTAAWMEGDLPTILSYFSETELDYSDYGLMALHMNKEKLIPYFQLMGSLFGDMHIETKAVHGAIDFCVWECVFEFTVLKDDPGVPYKKGERGRLFNSSVIEWKDGKIIKESDYAVWGNQETHAAI